MTDTGTAPQELDDFLGAKPRPKWRRWMKYWLPAALILVILLAMATCSRGKGEAKYITEPVTEKSLTLSVTATGNLRPTNQVEVGSEVSGKIDHIYVDVNDRVSKGQILAQINTDVIEDQITQAEANLNAARAQVAQAQATLDVDKAQLARLENVFKISGGKVPSGVELDQGRAAVKRDTAAVAAAQANVRAVIRSPVSGVVLARQVEPGQTVAASFNTPTLFIIAEDLSAMQLRVEIDEADVGQVQTGQKADFTVDAYPGRRFPAVVERVDQASSNTASQASQQTATATANAVVSYEARLAVANGDGLLRPGMTATATIATGSTAKQLLVPNGALRFQPDAKEKEKAGVLNPEIGLEKNEQRATIGVGSQQRVWVLQADGTLKPVDVVTGQSDGRLTAVTVKGLRPGMKVVTGKGATGQ
jgi:HlyD family secretion protein